jgi:PAS domain S-box-containing protein
MKKALIVDDNETNLYLLESLFKAHGLKVVTAENGEIALERARLEPPDVVVSDILMPVMDGYTLCRQWKSDARLAPIPFIFYTATFTESKDEEFALSLGADRFLVKPMEPEALIKIVLEILEKGPVATTPAAKPLGEDMEFFRRHDEALFRKLEKRMLDLEIANQKLRLLEENYRMSFQNVADVIYMIDTDLRFTSISPSIERILGYTPQEFVGHPVSDLARIYGPDTLSQALEDIALIFAGGTVSGRIYHFIAKDGTDKYGEVNGTPIRREGRIIGLISVARDITDRRKAEEELRRSERKYRELYDFLPIPVYEMDLEGNITSANKAIFETFGGAESNIEHGFKVWQILSPEGLDRHRENLRKLMAGEKVEGTEYTLRRLDGSEFPAIAISSVVRKDSRPVGVRGAIVDITERKVAEERLRQLLDHLNKSVNATVKVMAAAVEVRDPYTSGHQERVGNLARAIAVKMGLPFDRIEATGLAASIHDIGKLSVPSEILSKPTRLTDIEFALIKEHSQKGYDILKDVVSPWPLAEIIYQHHERMDGSGYPRQLKGESILLEARIIGVADVVEAMASHRPYRPAMGIEAALKEIEAKQGTAFDPEIVGICLALFREDGYRLPKS